MNWQAALLVMFSASQSFCAPPCTLPPLRGSKVPAVTEVGRFCAPPTFPEREAAVQVLVDDSGSMNGFRGHLPSLLLWSEQALSQVRQRGLAWSRNRACYFSADRNLSACNSNRLTGAGFRGASDTTLADAIRSAEDHDLTLLITDGASASGGKSADCAGGVDAACVGRALARAVAPQPGDPREVRGGVWLIPLVGLYRGTFYTEQPIAPRNLDSPAIENTIMAATATSGRILKPVTGARGLLQYQYEGPRVFLALVLARDVALGRAFVASLIARRNFAQIAAIDELRQYQNGLASLPPIEVYPGAAPTVKWQRSITDENMCRTLDARLRAGGVLQIDCPNARDEANVHLIAAVEPATSDCVTLRMLPRLVPAIQQFGSLATIRDFSWSGTGLDPGQPLRLALLLECRKSWKLDCDGGQSGLIWMLQRDYRGTAAALLGTGAAGTLGVTQRLSAQEVATRPHLVFQLAETLERFYRNAEQLITSGDGISITRIGVCKP